MITSLRQLRAFITIAEHGSFSAAAQALHLTQSALSGLMKELETHLEVRLFDRTTRRIDLSDAGIRLLPYAKRVLNEASALQKEVELLKNGGSGRVKLAVSQQLAASAMPRILGAFRRRQPDIDVQMLDCSVEQVIAQVHNAEVDFGIGPERKTPEGIEAVELFTLPFYAVLPPSHPLAAQETVDWAELRHEPLILLNGSFSDHLAAALPTKLAPLLNRRRYSVNFLSTALGLVKNGAGLTFCLPFAADWVHSHGLMMRPLCNPEIERRFLIYRRQNRSLSAAAENVLRFLTEPGIWQPRPETETADGAQAV
ncbi:LysR family transcriptional regulator [Neisseria leonii]|uniref:LysR family transcriptional regulator n=1 Tax=Neisseria leonii TaxID=2995413 RepID=UPI00237C2031|nr:LysR family transcriptional regulator [Neisseria sp. 3986]MDD9326685.1 LysR family transcriptional regulator [Neisseria sp. 3986]